MSENTETETTQENGRTRASILERIVSLFEERRMINAEARKITKKKRKEARIKAKYYKAALAFNALHCHTGDDLWMCPECNKVHSSDTTKTKKWGWLTGRQYPACCRFLNGHRLEYEDHATTGDCVKG